MKEVIKPKEIMKIEIIGGYDTAVDVRTEMDREYVELLADVVFSLMSDYPEFGHALAMNIYNEIQGYRGNA